MWYHRQRMIKVNIVIVHLISHNTYLENIFLFIKKIDIFQFRILLESLAKFIIINQSVRITGINYQPMIDLLKGK